MSRRRRSLGMIALVVVLPGCMKDMAEGAVSRFRGPEAASVAAAPEVGRAVANPSDASEIISALHLRPSAIEPGTPYARVADAVIASDARVAEAELRVAHLRAEAAAKNWMPRFGPRISLDSLGSFVAELVIEQVLFDNGRKVAERDLAKANVELAAVTLVEDGNTRVFDALSLYLTAQENRALAAHLEEALQELSHFEWVIDQRVRGGVSDMSDLNVVRQKLASMRARSGEAQEAAAAALAELNAMSAQPLAGLSGLGTLSQPMAGEALGVLRARAERARTLAEARIARAGHLPGLAASGSMGRDGTLAGGLQVTSDSLFSLGTAAELQAIEATRISADRKVAEAREVADRRIQSQRIKRDAYRRQGQEAGVLTAQAKTNLTLFRAQYEGGQRQVMDVVGVYETYAKALETEIELRFKEARAALDLARLQGVLVEGASL